MMPISERPRPVVPSHVAPLEVLQLFQQLRGPLDPPWSIGCRRRVLDDARRGWRGSDRPVADLAHDVHHGAGIGEVEPPTSLSCMCCSRRAIRSSIFVDVPRTRGCISAATVAVNRWRMVFSPQPRQAPSPLDRGSCACRAAGSRARRSFRRGLSMRLYSFGVVGRSSQKSQSRRSRSTDSSVWRHRLQRVVVADLDALHAALAGVGVDGDREQPAATRALLLGLGVEGPGEREAEVAELLAEQLELGRELARAPPPRASPRATVWSIASLDQLGDRIGLLRSAKSARNFFSTVRAARGRCSTPCPCFRMRLTTVSKTGRTALTRPGIAVSGQTV